jgi:large conductance mechanosensitive channel
MAKSEKAIRADEDRKIAAAAKLKGAASHGAGFMNFIREQGVVGLAVGLAIGTAAGDTVKQLVGAFIDPLVQLMIGSQDGLKAAEFTVNVGDRVGVFTWGAFVSSLISLLAVAFVVYAIVHMLKLHRADKAK